MRKIKSYTSDENNKLIEFDDYEPESPIKEAINIAKALKPLRFKVQGFCLENSSFNDYVLRLRFIRGLSHDTLDDFGETADSHKEIVINSSHDKPDGTV